MKFKSEYFFCSPKLLQNVEEIIDIHESIDAIKWAKDFSIEIDGISYSHQTGYNKAFSEQFKKRGWAEYPVLCEKPKLIGDFQHGDVFIEIQFGNSATIYRDYYKFHYGLTHNLLSLAVLIVPTQPKKFFPNRVKSVANMAEYAMASRCFKLLPIPVPILLIGLLPEN